MSSLFCDLATLKEWVAVLAAIISFMAHPLYIWAVVAKKETKPHTLTWVSSAIMAAVSLFLFMKAGGGYPVLMIWGDLVGLSVIAILAMTMSSHWDGMDWTCFMGAILGILIYAVYENAIIALVGAMASESLGMIPTIRKTYENPEKEDLLAWAFTCAGNMLMLVASDWGNPADVVYVVNIFVIDDIVLLMIIRGRFARRY